MDNKKIVFVISAMSRGGAERVISILSNYYVNNGYDVSIVMLWHNMQEYELDARIKLVDLSNDKIRPMLRLPFISGKLKRYLKSEKPDAVVSFIAQNNLISYRATKKLNTRLILSERNDPSVTNGNGLLAKLLRKAYAKSSLTVLQTERAKSFFPESVQNNSVIISNPIAVKAYATDTPKKRFVTAGRLAPQKNQKMLIDSFKIVHDKHPEYTLTIYGEGKLRAELEAQVSELHLNDVIELPGNVPDIHNKISDAYAFVLSSDYEGLSNALLEAMMMGLPCLSTDCAGSDEAIQSGENGIITPRKDTEAFANAMLSLIENTDLRNSIASKAKETAEKYKTENIIAEWKKAIEG